MPRLDDRIPESKFIGLFVGDSGTGKSVAEASFPRPMHFNDFDGRIGGVQGLSFQDTKDISYDFFQPKEPGLITKLNEKLEGLITASKLGQFGAVQLPKTYVTDSITNQTYAFVCQAIPLTHKGANPNDTKGQNRGKYIGTIAMPGPEDYGLEAQATYDYIAFLKSIPIPNILVSAHYVDRFAKSDPDNPFSENIVVGKKLSIRDKIGTNIQTHFDHIFEFSRRVDRYFVTFRGELARTSYSWLPNGIHEWTNRKFYDFMMEFRPKSQAESTTK